MSLPRAAANPGLASWQKRIKTLIAAAAAVDSREAVAAADAPALQVRLEELVKTAEKCALSRGSAGAAGRPHAELDAKGTHLWNLAASLARSGGADATAVLYVRLLAYYMLDCAQPPGTNSRRLFRVTVKLGRVCLEARELQWASKVLERAARYQKELDRSQEEAILRLSCEYFITRSALAWRQTNQPMADYMYTKATENEGACTAQTAEHMADVLHSIGNELLAQESYAAAGKWLQRCFDVLDKVECLSESGAELRSVTMQNLARCYIKEKDERASHLVEMLSEDWPTRLGVYVLKLELALGDKQLYHDCLLRAIAVIQLTDSSFKTVIGKIHVLAAKDVELACDCADALIFRALEHQDWIERAFVTRVWFSVKSSPEEDCLTKLLDGMSKKFAKPLGPKATHATQILLWRVSETFSVQQKYEVAGRWCRIALHLVFDKSGELNHAKIARRLIFCSIHQKEYGTAAEVFNGMSEAAKNAPFTRVLMFKLALRTSDDDLAMESMRKICEGSGSEHRLLYVCALDAQEAGHRRLALIALKVVLDEIDATSLPAAIRCTIRLTMSEIESAKSCEASVESLCALYEKALEHAQRHKAFSNAELDWFSRNGYNLGLRSIAEWPPAISLRILNTCQKFIDLCPESKENTIHRATTSYLCATLGIELARLEENIEAQLQLYLGARKHVEKYAATGESERGESMLLYDFEAATKLKDWAGCLRLVDEAAVIAKDAVTVEAMADMTICSGAPERTILAVLRGLLEIGSGDVARVARWLRCLVQVSLVVDVAATGALLQQALTLAQESGYPEEELMWLVATTWNRCIDFGCASDTTNAKRFAELAMSLAAMLQDGGLERELQGKLLECSWYR